MRANLDKFKEWYDDVFIGDGEFVTHIPVSVDDFYYSQYMAGWTLALGAYEQALIDNSLENYIPIPENRDQAEKMILIAESFLTGIDNHNKGA